MTSTADPIVILLPGPAYCRFRTAVEIQDASNPSGVARELVRVVASAMADPACTGTDWVCKDPAVVAVIDKLSNLAGRDAFESHRLCSERVRSPSAPPRSEGDAAAGTGA
jgi:hypothetical protein